MRNPKIAEIHYKDRHLDVTIPIRVKLIELTEYYCKKCRVGGTITDISRYCDRQDFFNNTSGKWLNSGLRLPETIFFSKLEIYCPDCFMKGEKNMMKLRTKKLYKAYSPNPLKFIRTDNIVTSYTAGNWKPAKGRWNWGKCEFYADKLSKIKDGMKWYNSSGVKKEKGVEVKTFKVTIKDCEQALKKSNLRKIARKI
jgi:hypothetical protein